METVAANQGTVGTLDEALVRRAARGDVAAFDALAASRLDRCYRLAWSIVHNDADAADATQDAFVAAWRMLPRLREVAAFDGWLNRIVANAALTTLRRRSRRREVQVIPVSADGDDVTAWAGDPPPGQPTESDAIVEREAMRRAFGRLRPHERAVLVLHHVDGRPVAEVARALGIPDGTVKSRLHAARRALELAMAAEAES